MAKVYVKLPNGKVKGFDILDIRPHFLFDTAIISSQEQSVTLFNDVTGKNSGIDYFIYANGFLPSGMQFELRKIRSLVRSGTAADIALVVRNTTVTYLKSGTEKIFTAPLAIFGGGAGVWTTKSDVDTAEIGFPANSSAYEVPFRIFIDSGETFSFELKTKAPTAPSAAVKLYFVLEGILKKPVVGA